jgi:hypothetical protein
MNTAKCVAATALFAVFAQQAVAESIAPATPPSSSTNFQTSRTNATSRSQFVWVQRIEGRDSHGNTRVLFSSLQGALLPLERLHQAAQLINPRETKHQVHYSELTLQLAGHLLTVSNGNMQRTSLPQGMSRNMVLRGSVEASETGLNSTDITIHKPSTEQVALLNR